MDLRDVKGGNWQAAGQPEVRRLVLKVVCRLPRPPPAFQVPTFKPLIPPALDRCPHLTATGKKEGLDKVALVYISSGYPWNCCEGPCDGEVAVGGRCHVLLPEDDARGSAFPRATIPWAPPSVWGMEVLVSSWKGSLSIQGKADRTKQI